MKKFAVSLIVPFVFGTTSLLAQNSNLNPTVQVTKDYKNTVGDMEKHTLNVMIPDSLFKFDLNFDYSGFENPYRGGTDFNPFLTELDIAPEVPGRNKFYLKAGAGYALSPEFDLSWSFKDSGRFKMGLYVSSKSFIGKYDEIVPGPVREFPQGCGVSRSMLEPGAGGKGWNGLDSHSMAGLNARIDWNKASMIFGVSYDNILARGLADIRIPDYRYPGDGVRSMRSYNSVGADLLLQSNLDARESHVRYSLGLHYLFGRDNVDPLGVTEHCTRVQVELGFRIGRSFLELNALTDVVSASPVQGSPYPGHSGWDAVVSPRYRISTESFSLGVGPGLLLDGLRKENPGSSNFYPWPSVKMEWNAIRHYLDIYLTSDIEGRIYGSRAQALDHHFYIPVETAPAIVVTRYSEFGLRGNIAQRMNWNLAGGYRRVNNAPVFGVTDACLLLCFRDLRSFYAAAGLNGSFSGFSFNASLRYDKYLDVNTSDRDAILPPPLSADIDLKYSFRSRISIGAGFTYCDSYISRACLTNRVAGLRASLDYKFAGPLTIYLKGENLLGHSMQRIPFYSPVGPEITAGIVLNF